MHPYGCRIVQRILEHGTEDQVNAVIAELRRFAIALAQDQVCSPCGLCDMWQARLRLQRSP